MLPSKISRGRTSKRREKVRRRLVIGRRVGIDRLCCALQGSHKYSQVTPQKVSCLEAACTDTV